MIYHWLAWSLESNICCFCMCMSVCIFSYFSSSKNLLGRKLHNGHTESEHNYSTTFALVCCKRCPSKYNIAFFEGTIWTEHKFPTVQLKCHDLWPWSIDIWPIFRWKIAWWTAKNNLKLLSANYSTVSEWASCRSSLKPKINSLINHTHNAHNVGIYLNDHNQSVRQATSHLSAINGDFISTRFSLLVN